MKTTGKQPHKITTRKPAKKPAAKIAPAGGFFVALCKSALQVEAVQEFRFHKTRQWRFDYAIPEHRIAIEVEGGVWTQGRHTRPQGFLRDMEKYNTAAVVGWRVLRFTPTELYTSKTLDLIRDAIINIKNE